jgi:hypothetical protein
MRTVAIISFSNLARDPRVDRQIRTICSIRDLSVVTIGLAEPAVPVRRHITVVPPPRNLKRLFISAALLLARRYEDYSAWTYETPRAISELEDIPMDLVIGNDFDSLPLAYRLAKTKKSRMLLDAHEFAPRQAEEKPWWKVFFQPYHYYLGHRYLPELDGMITVSEGIAREYKRIFGVTPQIITNAAPFADLLPSKVQNGRIRLVYHGAASPMRKIEIIINAMHMVESGTTLDMILLPVRGSEAYLLHLQRLVAGKKNVRLLPPIPMSDLVACCNKYDVGICFLPASNFNHKHALPNKFFEYIQSRLALVIGPSPEMARYVENYGLGNVARDFTSRGLAQAINELTKDSISGFKRNADAASKTLSAERNNQLLIKIVEDLLDYSPP